MSSGSNSMPTQPVALFVEPVQHGAEATSPALQANSRSPSGLTNAEVEALRARFGRNIVDSTPRRTWWRTLREVLAEPMFLLLLAASAVYFLIGDATQALTLLAFVMAIVLLTVVQSHRTARVLDSLRELFAPRAQVLRDGRRQLVCAAELVPGDVVFVDEGARVPADGAVTEAHELSVDESLLTGESVAVSKAAARDGLEDADVPGSTLFFGSMMASGGLRVLGVAKARHSHADWPEKQHDFEFSFLGLVGLLDPVRPEVAGAVAQCKAAGIRVVMITGDYPSTARAIAAEVGIGDGHIMAGHDLAAMNDKQLHEAVQRVDVFARVKPEQKLRLVQALRDSGHVVAMTGDGVNDAPALKAAHIGIAMGLRGAEVAREVASLVLLRDDFAPIVSAIRMGRRIYANLVQAISYTVAVHIPMIAATLIPVVAGLPPMLAPVHIVFLQLIIDPVCSVVFENEPERNDLMQVPPRRAGARLLSNRALANGAAVGALFGLLVLGLYIGLLTHGHQHLLARTLAFVALVVGNVALIFVIRMLAMPRRRTRTPLRNRYLWIVLGITAIALLLLLRVPALAQLFELAALLDPRRHV